MLPLAVWPTMVAATPAFVHIESGGAGLRVRVLYMLDARTVHTPSRLPTTFLARGWMAPWIPPGSPWSYAGTTAVFGARETAF